MVICGGCQLPIYDRYLFHVNDKSWHASCVTCSDCKILLVDRCYSRDGLLFCKQDFFRRFGTRCSGCDQLVAKEDLIRRARDKVFHVQCFTCSTCQKQLRTGEELYIVNGNKFVCKEDYVACRSVNGTLSECGSEDVEDEDLAEEPKSESELSLGLAELSPNATQTDQNGKNVDGQQKNSASPKKSSQGGDENGLSGTGTTGTKRRGPRTTIKAKQLETLKAAFAATPKPTRHIREQLAQETGLNMRVIQVWFQNRRSKERRMKQLRFGGYRPGRRSRGSREDPMAAQHMFQEGLVHEQFYQPHLGEPYYMMVGADSGLNGGLLPAHPFPSLLPPDDGVTPLEAHPPDRAFMVDDGSPDMQMGAEDGFPAHFVSKPGDVIMSTAPW